VLFEVLDGLGLFVLDDDDIVIEMLGLGFVEGPSLDGKFMAIGEHTVRSGCTSVSSDIWDRSLMLLLAGPVAIAADFEPSGSLRLHSTRLS